MLLGANCAGVSGASAQLDSHSHCFTNVLYLQSTPLFSNAIIIMLPCSCVSSFLSTSLLAALPRASLAAVSPAPALQCSRLHSRSGSASPSGVPYTAPDLGRATGQMSCGTLISLPTAMHLHCTVQDVLMLRRVSAVIVFCHGAGSVCGCGSVCVCVCMSDRQDIFTRSFCLLNIHV